MQSYTVVGLITHSKGTVKLEVTFSTPYHPDTGNFTQLARRRLLKKAKNDGYKTTDVREFEVK